MLFELFGTKKWEDLSESSVEYDDSSAINAMFFHTSFQKGKWVQNESK